MAPRLDNDPWPRTLPQAWSNQPWQGNSSPSTHADGVQGHSMSRIQSQSQSVRPRRYDREREDSDSSVDDHHRSHRAAQRPPPQRRRPRAYTSSSDTDEDAERQTTGFSSSSNRIRSSWSRDQRSHHPRLPPFTGQEQWTVWFNRFKDVARLHGWTEKEKLAELLLKLQGNAATFVYELLSPAIRRNFKELVRELSHRFRKVENPQTFMAQFSKRDPHQGEAVEEYAADLKRLYDKAHPARDPETRQEDLLRRFLDGLMDDRARFQVEYVKEPKDIDDAVYEMVNFMETRRRSVPSTQERKNRHPTRAVNNHHHESDDCSSLSDDSDCEVRTVNTRGTKPRPGSKHPTA